MSPALLADRLNEAARAGTALTILYRAEGGPAVRYRILPVAATSRVLRARDLASERMKAFLLDQLEIVADVDPEAPAPPPAPSRPSDDELLAAAVDELRRLGWHVVTTRDRLAVHLTHPDGKLVKAPAAYVALNTPKRPTSRLVSRRPWTVVAPGMAKAHTLARLDSAIELFMTQLRAHPPAVRGRRRPPPPRA